MEKVFTLNLRSQRPKIDVDGHCPYMQLLRVVVLGGMGFDEMC